MAEQREKRRPTKRIARIVIILVIIVAVTVAVLLMTGVLGSKPEAVFATDDKAQTGELTLDEPNAEKALEELQSAVDASRFSFRINSRPEFESGTGEGTLMIENPADNTQNMQVTITLDETGGVLYESGMIPPNSNIARDVLQTPLPMGEYPATAGITVYDTQTKERVGTVMAGLTIVVRG